MTSRVLIYIVRVEGFGYFANRRNYETHLMIKNYIGWWRWRVIHLNGMRLFWNPGTFGSSWNTFYSPRITVLLYKYNFPYYVQCTCRVLITGDWAFPVNTYSHKWWVVVQNITEACIWVWLFEFTTEISTYEHDRTYLDSHSILYRKYIFLPSKCIPIMEPNKSVVPYLHNISCNTWTADPVLLLQSFAIVIFL